MDIIKGSSLIFIIFTVIAMFSIISYDQANFISIKDQFDNIELTKHQKLKKVQIEPQIRNNVRNGVDQEKMINHINRNLQQSMTQTSQIGFFKVSEIKLEKSKVSSLQFGPQQINIIAKFQAITNNNMTTIKFIGYDKKLEQKSLLYSLQIPGIWNVVASSADGSCAAIYDQDKTLYETIFVNKEQNVLERMNLNVVGQLAQTKVGNNCSGFAFNNIQSNILGQKTEGDVVYRLKDGKYIQTKSPATPVSSHDNTFTYVAVRSFLVKYNQPQNAYNIFHNIELLTKTLIIKRNNRIVIKTENKTIQGDKVNYLTKILVYTEQENNNIRNITQQKIQFQGQLKMSKQLDLLLFYPSVLNKTSFFIKINYQQSKAIRVPYPSQNLQYSTIFIMLGENFFYTVSLSFGQYYLQVYQFNGQQFVIFHHQILVIPLQAFNFIVRGEIVVKQSQLTISLLGENFLTGSKIVEFQSDIQQQGNLALTLGLSISIPLAVIIIIILIVFVICNKRKKDLQKPAQIVMTKKQYKGSIIKPGAYKTNVIDETQRPELNLQSTQKLEDKNRENVG